MQQSDPMSTPVKRKLSPLTLVIGAIMAVCLAILFIPSNRDTRQAKAKLSLQKDYAGPKDISNLYEATLISIDNKRTKVSPKDEAQILVFAPNPKDSVTSNTFMELQENYYGANVERKTKNVCLLAPDPTSTGWSLFAKVLIGHSLEIKQVGQIATSLSQQLIANPPSAIKELNNHWMKFSPKTQAEATRILEENRKIVAKLPGVHQYFQDGTGTNYEITVSGNIWSFRNYLYEAYPNRRSGR
jgi:hypothetical protein